MPDVIIVTMNNFITRRALLIAAAGAMYAQQPGPADLDRIQVGQPALPFALPSAAGGKTSLESLRGKNVVLVFYRGYW